MTETCVCVRERMKPIITLTAHTRPINRFEGNKQITHLMLTRNSESTLEQSPREDCAGARCVCVCVELGSDASLLLVLESHGCQDERQNR